VTDPVLISHALRGVRLRCRYGWHKMRLMTRHKIVGGEHDGVYRTVTRCQKCGLVRHEEGRV
jgi:hypothetical protein